ncbi:Nn.00g031500.m01.CDS01 [Neocucurbitaria sp. VM-36]
MSYLLELPTEVLIEIVSLCRPADIKRLCETCEYLHSRSTPELYRSIDISSHNADIRCEPFGVVYHRVPPDFFNRTWTWLDYVVFEKQKKLIQTLDKRSELGRYVRGLRWTVLDVSECGEDNWEDMELGRELEEKRNMLEVGERFISATVGDPLWRTFHSFVNVAHVDICWQRGERDLILPKPLFPSATSVRLSGCMTRELVHCILVRSSPQLRHIELSNLLQWAEVEPALPDLTNAQEWEEYWKKHGSDHKTIPYTRLMAGALDTFVGRCMSLTSLCITTVGRDDLWRPHPWDDRRYSSWARFLESVRNQLHYFSFKQGESRNAVAAPRGSRPGIPHYDYREMDRLFREWILPVLLAAPWPHMRRLEIRGVGRSVKEITCETPPLEKNFNDPGVLLEVEHHPSHTSTSVEYKVKIIRVAFHAAAQEQLQNLLPKTAELIVEEEPERDYEDISFGSDDNGIYIC